jgi:hypothetical protein
MAARAEEIHRSFGLSVEELPDLAPGRYVMAILEFAITGGRERSDVVPVLWRVGAATPLNESKSRAMLIHLLDHAGALEGEEIERPEALATTVSSLRSYLGQLRASITQRERALESARNARRRETQEATLLARVRAADQRLTDLRRRQSHDFPIRMAEARLSAEKRRLEAFQGQVSSTDQVAVQEREVAVVYLLVRSGRGGGRE